MEHGTAYKHVIKLVLLKLFVFHKGENKTFKTTVFAGIVHSVRAYMCVSACVYASVMATHWAPVKSKLRFPERRHELENTFSF